MKFKIIKKTYKHDKTPEDFGINKYKVNSDGSLDVFGNIYVTGIINMLPFFFNEVNGDFNLINSVSTLEGCPKIVNGYFSCSRNNLESLEGAPETVANGFFCHHNNLKDLKYSPKIVKGDYSCHHNNLKTLDDLNLDGIEGKIFAGDNPDLILSDKVKLWMDLNPGRLKIK